MFDGRGGRTADVCQDMDLILGKDLCDLRFGSVFGPEGVDTHLTNLPRWVNPAFWAQKRSPNRPVLLVAILEDPISLLRGVFLPVPQRTLVERSV